MGKSNVDDAIPTAISTAEGRGKQSISADLCYDMTCFLYMTQAVCKYDCTHTLSVLLSSTALRSPSVRVWATGCTCMLKFSRHPSLSVCACTVLHVSTYTFIMTQKCATKRTNNYCLLTFAGSCYRARVSECVCVCVCVCVQNPIIPQCVLSAAS